MEFEDAFSPGTGVFLPLPSGLLAGVAVGGALEEPLLDSSPPLPNPLSWRTLARPTLVEKVAVLPLLEGGREPLEEDGWVTMAVEDLRLRM